MELPPLHRHYTVIVTVPDTGSEVIGPDPMALYRLYAQDGTLLYIGITHSLRNRFASHAQDKPWWSQVAKKTVTWHGSREEVLAAEASAIQAEDPVHNIIRPETDQQRCGEGRADRHKRQPRAVRIPEDLEEWYACYAAENDRSIHAALIEGLEAFRRRTERAERGSSTGTTFAPRVKPKTPPQTKPAPAANPCQHTRAKRMKLLRCPDCTAFLGP